MQRFLFKATIFVVGMWVLLNGFGYIAEYLSPQDRYLADAENNYSNFLKHKSHLQAITIGNSHANAIDFDTLDLEGQTLGRAGADLFEIQSYIDNVVKEAPNLKIAFIAVSYFSLDRDNAASRNRRILRINLYAMLPIWIPTKGDAENLILGKLHKASRIMYVARPDSWYRIVYGTPDPPDSDNDNSVDKQEAESHPLSGQCGRLTDDELDTMAYKRVQEYAMKIQEEENAHQNLQEDTFQALAKTIETLQAHNIRVILFTPPYSNAYNTYFEDQAPEMINDMRQALYLLQEEYKVEYYDFSNNLELTTHNEFFYNSDHLNDCGRKAFSERLLKAMLK